MTSIGVVTVHDGPSLGQGEIIAPVVGDEPAQADTYHNKFQDADNFLRAGGQLAVVRGRRVATHEPFFFAKNGTSIAPAQSVFQSSRSVVVGRTRARSPTALSFVSTEKTRSVATIAPA